ncbi:MAG: glycosyltransferase family A protein [Anaerolineales bacterium]|jgi:glycosyltransferase involved in cell wall biosynthesis
MPRIGQNPAKKDVQADQAADLTIAVLVYIPYLKGYYRQSLDVLRACLDSISAHTPQPFDLMVFDNASCPEVVEFLTKRQQGGQIQYLLLSEKNLGKVGAWNMIFTSAPGEYIVYADSDVYFLPGWLPRHKAVFDAFPQVGTVSGLPLREEPKFCRTTLKRVEELPDVEVRKGQFIPQDWIKDHVLSLDKEDELETDLARQDTLVRSSGVEAFVTGAHFQFMIRKEIIQPYLPFKYSRPMGPDVAQFDQAIDDHGYLRLAVTQRSVYHIGNRLDDEVIKDVLADRPIPPKAYRRVKRPFWLRGPIKHAMLWIYDKIFQLIFGERF